VKVRDASESVKCRNKISRACWAMKTTAPGQNTKSGTNRRERVGVDTSNRGQVQSGRELRIGHLRRKCLPVLVELAVELLHRVHLPFRTLAGLQLVPQDFLHHCAHSDRGRQAVQCPSGDRLVVHSLWRLLRQPAHRHVRGLRTQQCRSDTRVVYHARAHDVAVFFAEDTRSAHLHADAFVLDVGYPEQPDAAFELHVGESAYGGLSVEAEVLADSSHGSADHPAGRRKRRLVQIQRHQEQNCSLVQIVCPSLSLCVWPGGDLTCRIVECVNRIVEVHVSPSQLKEFPSVPGRMSVRGWRLEPKGITHRSCEIIREPVSEGNISSALTSCAPTDKTAITTQNTSRTVCSSLSIIGADHALSNFCSSMGQ